jgi:hypothetical protein
MWKVIGFMEGKEGNARYPERDKPVYGPLPRKMWIPVAGEKYKVRKPPAAPRTSCDWRSVDERRAVEYARWLAARDRLELPDEGRITAIWSKITTRAGKPSNRIRAITFTGNNAYPVSIILPNWDFDPVEPMEEIVSADVAFDDFRARGLQTLLQAA